MCYSDKVKIKNRKRRSDDDDDDDGREGMFIKIIIFTHAEGGQHDTISFFPLPLCS